ncbi:MAG: hypothetical protein GW948_02245 [Rhodobacterales bacterium]|nr:hypothetical protein [Rhodobacterales bacterium]
MAENGVRTTELASAATFDEVIGGRNGDTVRIELGRLVATISTLVGPSYQNRSTLYANLAWPEGAIGTVWGDATSGFIGTYKKAGASGAGSWSRIGDLPSSGLDDSLLAAKAPINDPTFTGIVSGITKSMVELPNVDNTSDVDKPLSTAQAAAIATLVQTLQDIAARLSDRPDGWHIAFTNADETRVAGGLKDAPGGGVRFVFFDMLIPAGASVDDADGSPIVQRLLPAGLDIESGAEAGYVLAVVSADGTRLKFGVPDNDDPIAGRFETAVAAETVVDGGVTMDALAPEVTEVLTAAKYATELSGGALWVNNLTSGQRVEIVDSGASDPVLFGDAVAYTVAGARLWRPCDGSKPAAPFASKLDAIYHIGDSLTAAAGGVGSLGALLGITSINRAVGGWSVNDQAARAGAITPLVTLTGNTLPGSGSVVVTAISPSTGWSPYVDVTLTGTILGVPVTMFNDVSEGVRTITRVTPGDAVSVPAGTPFISSEDQTYRENVATIFIGRNAVTSATFEADTLAAIAAIVAHLPTFVKRYVVIGVTNAQSETDDTADYAKIVGLNAQLAEIYGDFFYDLRRDFIDEGLTRAGITPTTDDLEAIEADAPPSSIMFDAVHPTATGYGIQRDLVAEWLQAKGWF